MYGFAQLVQSGNITVMVNAQLGSSIGTLRGKYAGIFHNNQPCAAFGTLFIIINVQKTHFAVLLTVICSHGHHDNPVFHGHALDGKGFKNMFVFIFHGRLPPGSEVSFCRSCWRILCRSDNQIGLRGCQYSIYPGIFPDCTSCAKPYINTAPALPFRSITQALPHRPTAPEYSRSPHPIFLPKKAVKFRAL